MVCLLFVTAQITFSQADPALRITDVTLTEGDDPQIDLGTEPVQISLSAPSTKDIKVTISTQPGTAQSGDFNPVNGVEVTIPAGNRSILLSVQIKGDTVVEGTEEFFLNLSNPVNATIADAQAVATIIDDDALILLTQPSSGRAAALDSPLFTQEIFPIINSLNFSSDKRTRISVFAIGLKMSTTDTASAVTATAEDSTGKVWPLPPAEFVGAPSPIQCVVVNNKKFCWLIQVVLKLDDQLPTPGDFKIRITLQGVTSNAVLVGLKSQ